MTAVKRGRRCGVNYFCMNPGIAVYATVYANLIFLQFCGSACLAKIRLGYGCFPQYMK